ncbi:unnamed protein product [Caenorhabditis bovis]|uniref:Phosphoinositide 5-phosphatase n=1 Tax=Caenorhabditis bovis TaxID=2654633 RepID=A0A8S1ENC9_9PELO|nr:unnamed protein product [Caenorhabditis bovis]
MSQPVPMRAAGSGASGSGNQARPVSLRSDDSNSPQPRKLEVVSKQATKVTALSTKLEWKIEQFEKLMKLVKNGCNLISRQFSVPQAPTVCWELHVYPNGKREEDMNNVSFFLRQVGLQRGEEPIMTEFQIYTLDANSQRISVCRDTKDFTNQQGRGKFQVSRDKMMGALKADGSLFLICEVEYFPPGSKISVEPVDDDSFIEDIDEKTELSIRDSNRDMWENELFTDCVIKVGNKQIKAHRCILGQHSPVFRSMFSSETMIEAQKGVIDILDAKYESVKAMVEFMYTGNTDALDSHSIDEILAIADKYEVLPLKEQCERLIALTINHKNLTNIAVFSDTYTANILKQAVIRYLTLNHKNVIKTSEWKMMKKERHELANELLEAVLTAGMDMLEDDGASSSSMDWKVTILTYNVAMKQCDESAVDNFLHNCGVSSTSIVTIGLQEVAHAETIGGALVTWAKEITAWMNEKMKLVLLAKNYQATNQILIFGKKSIIPFIKRIDFRFARNTMGGLTGHKGSIGVRIQLRSPYSIVFVDSHFVHDAAAYQKRIAQYHTNRVCSFPDDSSVRATFWFGDLNFRLEEETSTVIRKIKAKSYLDLLDSREQLKRAIIEEEAFSGYSEQSISFPPTYRMFMGTTEHDPKRTPSWCDRVLFKGSSVSPEEYCSIEDALASDHLPVRAKFSIHHLPTWYSSIPLVGRFQVNHEFYQANGSYRDWVGVFPISIDDCTQSKHWIYFATCFEQTIEGQKYYTCEFADVPPGSYRLGYYSTYLNCLVGLSKSFQVIEQP